MSSSNLNASVDLVPVLPRVTKSVSGIPVRFQEPFEELDLFAVQPG